ncbi:MAG: hypothetical protein JOZ41_20005 [Chloroflexi bacterium]|nr:hypothetical protein [Chloroflexota bacterium]
MKSIAALLGIGLILTALAGCGSGGSDALLKLACSSRKLPSGAIRVQVTVTNTTDRAKRAIIYGPAIGDVSHIYPVLTPTHVTVLVGKGSATYDAFIISQIPAQKSAYLLLRFAPPMPAQSILVSERFTVRASDWSVLDNPDCRIKRVR